MRSGKIDVKKRKGNGMGLKRRRTGVVVKTPGEIDAMKAAGQLSAEVLRKVGEAVRPGVTTLELEAASPHSRATAASLVRSARR